MLPTLSVVLQGHRLVVATHGLAIVAGVAAGAALALRRAPLAGPVLIAVALVVPAILVGSHLLFAALHGGSVSPWSGGLASMGGVAAGLAAAWLAARLTREPLPALLDRLVPAALLALGIGRVGCFLGGCCYGRPTDMPWGVVFPDVGLPARHPLQLYSAAVDVALVVALLRVVGPPGTVARIGLGAFGLLRAALDLLRDPATADLVLGGRFTLAQAVGVLLAVSAAVSWPPCAPGWVRLSLGRPRAAP